MLHLYNSLTRKLELFQPRNPPAVHMYVCGMTVYDYCHIGHGRVLVVFDALARYLRHRGYQLDYVRNITDIDDKIIKRAHENGESWQALTTRFIHAMREDELALNVVPPTHEPKATEAIPLIIELIEKLIAKHCAYLAANGDVYYAVRQFPDYGKLSGKSLDDLRSGARVEVDEIKRDPLDFVLWKAAKPQEPAWDSPWGPGRPGWHIECSAMSFQQFGPHFDIHGGGLDLQFPHHENEIAQSEAAHSCPYANYWLHNGFVQVNNEKMSKSLGNFFTLREVLKHYRGEVIRFFILSSHYRKPLNYSQENLENAKAALNRFYLALRDAPLITAHTPTDDLLIQSFYAALDDDLNTPEAIAVLFEITRKLNSATDENHKRALAATLRFLGNLLGLLELSPHAALTESHGDDELAYQLTDDAIEQLIADRQQARKDKQWQRADELRQKLADAGIILEDAAGQTRWRRS